MIRDTPDQVHPILMLSLADCLLALSWVAGGVLWFRHPYQEACVVLHGISLHHRKCCTCVSTVNIVNCVCNLCKLVYSCTGSIPKIAN